MRILDRVHKENKRVTSFVSWCGGLPEPVASNVPLGYKFSWSPKAVLTAALNEAKYKLGGKLYEIPGEQLLSAHIPSVQLWKGLALEGVANRDSIPYAEKYGMGGVDDLQDLFRGTLRYKGFSTLLDSFRRLGLLSSEPLTRPAMSWEEFLRQSTGRHLASSTLQLKQSDMSSVLRDVLGDQAEETRQALEWYVYRTRVQLIERLSLLPSADHVRLLAPPSQSLVPIDLFASLLSQRLAYGPNERDSVLLHHTFKLASGPSSQPINMLGVDKPKIQAVTASLLCYGTPEASAMSVTVGKTLAFAAGRVLDGHVRVRGVRGPYERDVWEGVLSDLESAGVEVKEEWA